MKYFLIKLELKVVGNLIEYCRPDWYLKNGLDLFETKSMTETNSADKFVDLVIELDNIEKIAILESKNVPELSLEEFESWKKYKQLILSLNPIIDEEVI